jgi:predicted peptidase
MKYRLGLYSAVLLSVLGCASQPVSKIEQLAEKVVDSNASRYQIHLPSDYEASQAPYPLLVFLHGNGDKGSDMQIGSGANLLLQQAPQKGFVVAIPQLPFDHAQWSPEVVHTLIDDIETRYRIDPGKISLGGYSLGGFGSLGAAMAQPERFAALFSIAGGDPLHLSSWTLPGQESMPVDQAMMCRIADIPTWIFHGSRDLIVPVGAAVEVNMAS